MPIVAIVFGGLLIPLGLFGYFLSGSQHPTALIPTIVGCIFVCLGTIARVPKFRKHAMHAAAAIGLLGFFASAGRLIAIFATSGSPPMLGLITLGGMALLTLIFVLLCVRSFITTRRNRLV
ncbi:MAG TPA: hypothetical protein VKK61_05030 [Tepidisphaeraceae bacterium]|nr:hypothetical protein [Tepidisphaeraceae bacterium]